MVADESRIEPYVRALQATVSPGSVVVDLGAGVGLFALLASRLGARRVYAIEPSPAIQVLEEASRRQGFGDRIECLQAMSTDLELPEPADLIVADLRGTLPWFGTNVPTMIDARERLLKPNGILIPRRDTLRGAPAELAREYDERTGVWRSGRHGVDLSSGRPFAVNSFWSIKVLEEQLLSEPQTGAVLDYLTVDSPEMGCTLGWRASRKGIVHGLCFWFESELVEGVEMSSGPASPACVYRSAVFPLEEPVPVEKGDEVEATLSVHTFDEEHVWSWRTQIRTQREVIARFSQSTLLGQPLTKQDLERRSSDFVPALDISGEVAALILTLVDGKTDVGAIAEEARRQYPSEFQTRKAALERVTALLHRYAR